MKNSTIGNNFRKFSREGTDAGGIGNYYMHSQKFLRSETAPSHFFPTSNLSTLEATHNRNNHLMMLNSLREFYSLLNDIDINKEKMTPNIIVTGYEGSGKSSFIEYLLGMDLFPLNYFNKKTKAPLKIQINRHVSIERKKEENDITVEEEDNPITPTHTPTQKKSNHKITDEIKSKVNIFESNFRGTPKEIESNNLENYNNNNIQTDNSPSKLAEAFSFKFYFNEEISFTNLSDLHRHFEETDLMHYVDEQGYINIRIEINIVNSEKENTPHYIPNNMPSNILANNTLYNLFFDCKIFEIDIQDLSQGKYHLSNNNIFMICSPSDKTEKFESSVKVLMESPMVQIENLDTALAVFTKPDKLDNHKDFVEVQQLCSKYGIKYGFIRLRSYEERRTCPKMMDFQNNELKYYEDNCFFGSKTSLPVNTSEICGLNVVIEFIYNSLINLFNKNFKDNEQVIHSAFDHEYHLISELGKEMPSDPKLKYEKLKRSLKILLKYVKELSEFTLNNLISFIETKIYSCDNMSRSKTTGAAQQYPPLIKDLICLKEANLKPIISSKEITKKLNKVNYTPNKKELETVLFALSQKLLTEQVEKLKQVFQQHSNAAMNRIHNKISTLFSKIIDPFKEKLMIYFNDFLEEQNDTISEGLGRFEEMEKNIYYFKNKEFHRSFIDFYTSYLIPNNFSFDDKYMDFCVNCVSHMVKEKLTTIMEHFCKVYSYFFYAEISDKMADMSVENLIEVNFERDLQLYTEEEEIKIERGERKKSLSNLLKLEEIMSKVGFILSGRNLDSSVMNISMHKSFMKGNAHVNLSPVYKEMLEKFNKLSGAVDVNSGKTGKTGKTGKSVKRSKTTSALSSPFREEEKEESHFDFYDDYNALLFDEGDHCNISHHTTLSNEMKLPQISPVNKKPSIEIESASASAMSTTFTAFTRINKEYVMIWDNTDQISVYNIEKDKIQQFRVQNIPLGLFLEDNRYINVDNKIFISGGMKSDLDRSILFMELTRPQNEITVLKSLPEPRVRHSLIYLPDLHAVAVVGGMDAKKTFIYKLDELIWEDFGDLKVERLDPSLFLVNGDILFCLGGVREENKQNAEFFIEFRNCNNGKGWNKCGINTDNSPLDSLYTLSGVGFAPLIPQKDTLVLLGGYNANSLEDSEKSYTIKFKEENKYTYREDTTDTSQIPEILLHEQKFSNAEKIQSWFPENNFVHFEKNGDEMINFNVDGEVVKFSCKTKEIQIIPFKFKSDNN